jgi:hypothetical protein
MSKALQLDGRTRKTFVVTKAMIDTASPSLKPVTIKRLRPTAAPAPALLDPARSPRSRATTNLLLDKFPLKLSKGPSKSQVEQEYLVTKKSFKQVLSEVPKLLDTSKSCRLLTALKESKAPRFKLQGAREYESP